MAAGLMKSMHQDSVIVVDEERIVGLCTERDFVIKLIAEGLSPDRTTLNEIMTPCPETITADRPLVHALHAMLDGGYRHMPVVDGSERPLGMVSARDALELEVLEIQRERERAEEIREIL
jgi:CBS domain-containing protein